METIILPSPLKSLLPHDLCGLCVARSFKKGEKLFQVGKQPLWMFFVTVGEVTLERVGLQGEPVVLQRTRLGFVSEASLKVSKYHCDALATVDTNVIQVPVRDLAHAIDNDSEFAGRWIQMLNVEVRRLRLHCERLSMKSVKDRLIHLIQTEGKNGHYLVPTGLKTLAGELGVTHEALYRTIAELRRLGVIERSCDDLVLIASQTF